ncbi:response regulator transcription factor [Patescibacteria group bacterium]|nr:MAG: response regulator transcription factor [Patescibacteria group bacterium]
MAKKTLLMIDQDAYYAKIYANRFEAAGWKVWVEDDMTKAKKRLKRSVPDVLIINLDPLDEALAFLVALRVDPRSAKTVQLALSHQGNRKTMLAALESGVDAYFLKGHMTPSEAVKKVKRLLEEKTSL